MSGPQPSDLSRSRVRRVADCWVGGCTWAPVQVIGTEGMRDLDRDGRLYACPRHLLAIEGGDVPAWATCSGAFCTQRATMGVGLPHGGVVYHRLLWACGSREHALYAFDLVPVDLR